MSTRTPLADLLDRFRQPEYTGENRCIPCTVTNVAIAAVLALGLAFLLVTPIGVFAFLVCLGVIYLRGYLVPGTPEITQQYFPPWLLSLFGKSAPIENVFDVSERSPPTDTTTTAAANGSTATTRTATAGTEPESGTTGAEPTGNGALSEASAADGPLFAAGVVARDDSGEVVLTSSFRAAWHDRIESVRENGVEPADVGETFGAEDVRQTGETSFVLDSSASVRWESNAALVADVAAAALLCDRLPNWTDFEKDDRTATLTGLRLFLGRCPTCDGSITSVEDRADPCCQKPHLVVTATCEECGAPIADAAVVDSGEDTPIRVRLLRA